MKATPGSIRVGTRGRGAMVRSVIVGLMLDTGLSYAAFVTARAAGAPVVAALLIGAAVSVARAIWTMARSRRIEGFAVFMAALFTAGAIVSLLSGSETFMLVKESFVTAGAGAAFLVSVCVGKPLGLIAAQKVAAPTAAERSEWDSLWRTEPIFRTRFRRLTVVVGAALVLEATVRVCLVVSLPADAVVGLSNLLFFGTLTLVSVWAVRYALGTQHAIDADHAAIGADH